MFRYFENLIDPFRPAPAGVPPRRVAAFYWHYIAQVWPAFAVLLLLGLLGALTEVALFGFLGRIVDLLQTTHPAALFAEHGHSLIGMAMVALLARPMAFLAHDLLLNQTIKPSLSSLIRWQNHRHVLRQSLGFFHGDFAGRIANRVMSTGASLRESASQVVDALWYVMVYVGSALWLFADANLWLMLPLLAWVALYLALMRRYVPRLAQRSQATSDARSRLMGRIVDGYSNILTLKLFARTEGEEDYVRDALDEQTQKHRQMGRVITLMDFYMTVLNGLLIVVTTALALWLWSLGTVSAGDVALSSGLVIRIVNMSGWILWTVSGIFEDIGTVQDGIDTISRPLELVDAPAAPALQVSRGQLQFDAVRFAYPKSAPIFNDFSLRRRRIESIDEQCRFQAAVAATCAFGLTPRPPREKSAPGAEIPISGKRQKTTSLYIGISPSHRAQACSTGDRSRLCGIYPHSLCRDGNPWPLIHCILRRVTPTPAVWAPLAYQPEIVWKFSKTGFVEGA